MYKAYVTKIKNIRPIEGADRLNQGECFGSAVVIGKDYDEDTLYLYFASDGQLSEEYAAANDLVRRKDEQGNNVGGFLDPDKRNIKAIKLRGVRSDGLVMPLSSLSTFGNISDLKEGDTIDTFNGHLICKKYIPQRRNKGGAGGQPQSKKIKTVEYPHFTEHVSTPQLQFSLGSFKKGSIISITEKVHGTSQREAFTVKRTEKKNWFQKLFNLKGRTVNTWEYVSGTRRVILGSAKDKEGGFYGDNNFRKQWSDKFVDKLVAGEEVFLEVVGYHKENAPIMASGDNKKLNDKEFVKKYGATTNFSYGCDPAKGESRIFIYRMTYTNEDGYTIEYPWSMVKLRAEQMGLEVVPELDTFIYTTEEDFLERVNKHLDVSSVVDPTHISEGVIVRDLSAATLKIAKAKAYTFKVLEGLIKETADAPDMEEQDDA